MTQHLQQLPQPDPIAHLDPDRKQQREIAFEQWAFGCRRNPRKVAELIGVPERTIRDWVVRYGWEAERTRRLAELVPHLAAGVVEDTVYALVNSARYARLASQLPTDDAGNEHTAVVVDQTGTTHYLSGPTRDRTQLAELALKLADALAGDSGLAGLLAGMRGTAGTTPLAAIGSPAPPTETAQAIIDRVRAERDALVFRTE